MKKLTDEIVIDFLTRLFPDDIDGIWADSNTESFSFNSENLGTEELWGSINGIEYGVQMGAFKICFILEGYDCVIKMPLTGRYDVYWDDECGEDRFEIIEDIDIDDIDDIGIEVDRYRTASKTLKNFLLPNVFVGVVKDIPVYKQEAVKGTYTEIMSERVRSKKTLVEEKYEKIATEYRSNGLGLEFPIPFLGDIIKTHKNPEKILQDTQKLTDLHYANIGYTFSGKAVCFDYAM